MTRNDNDNDTIDIRITHAQRRIVMIALTCAAGAINMPHAPDVYRDMNSMLFKSDVYTLNDFTR